MASAKQLAWRKKFARMSKAGKFRGKKGEKTRIKTVKASPNVKAYHSKKKYPMNMNQQRYEKSRPVKISTGSEYTGKWSRRYWKNKTKNVYAYIDFKNGKYYVITFRKNASPQWFKHKAMTLSEALSYDEGFNFQNK